MHNGFKPNASTLGRKLCLDNELLFGFFKLYAYGLVFGF